MKIILTFFAGVLAVTAVSQAFAMVAVAIEPCFDVSCSGPQLPGQIGLCVDSLEVDPNHLRCGCQYIPFQVPAEKYCKVLWVE